MQQVLAQAPVELTRATLRRIGEGIGRVVYASESWVVKRERSPSEVVALIMLWRILRRIARSFPSGIASRLMERPSRIIRFLRVVIQAVMLIVPRSLWFGTHIRSIWRTYHRRNVRGAKLAESHLTGTDIIPRVVSFPPTRLKVRGWPGWLIVTQAEERAEGTLFDHLNELAEAGFFPELEEWLERFLELRQAGWSHGVFSVDAHLKNFGVIGDRLVLLDTGGLTDRWSEIESRLERDSAAEPHIQLGLGPMLVSRPDIAARFNARWRATVNRDVVMRQMAGTEP